MYMIYGNGDCFSKIKYDIENGTSYHSKRYNSLYDVFIDLTYENDNLFHITDLSIKPYCYDGRINKMVYMITLRKYGNEDFVKKYGCPQFYKYLIDLNQNLECN